MIDYSSIKIAVIGLGYVGLPLAVAFSARHPTLGFDVNDKRIGELREGFDSTKSVENLNDAVNITFTSAIKDLESCNVYIIAVPTPIDNEKNPDLSSLKSASHIVATNICFGDVVVYESTVFPGATEDICIPILEKVSGKEFNKDFFCGYSPERINPGDKEHSLANTVKVVSGSNIQVSNFLADLYGEIITAGIHKAETIKIAEAAKIIENTQRDINIALMNELAVLFKKLDIDTYKVLKAANTKWNFLDFKPGLVGGHCIGVDPYYLTHKALQVGHTPEVILAGRKVNDAMASHIAQDIYKSASERCESLSGLRSVILGFSFKENCGDIRNTKIVDLYYELKTLGIECDIIDPHVNTDECINLYGIDVKETVASLDMYQLIIVAVPHYEFEAIDWNNLGDTMIYDLKSFVPSATFSL
jgi:UDP-N-acetyl-D-glucosamine/UDP-N-acetyl-D-galactosamine dehydrogenase